MQKLFKFVAVATLTGALAFTFATPSQARHGYNAAAIGFAAGALTGAAIASANNGYYYGSGYYSPSDVYDSYAYAPGVYNSYAYAPMSVYVAPARSEPACATDGGYGRLDYYAC